MRYLACFKPLGADRRPAQPPEGARSHFDISERIPAAVPDHLVPSVMHGDFDEFDLRAARAVPPWVRHWSGPFEAVVTRLDDRRFGAARQALEATAGEGDWHWIRYTEYPEGDELRFMRTDGAVRHVMFRDGTPVVSVVPW